MKDEIIYCSNLEQLKQDLAENGFVDDEGNYTHGMTKTPTVVNGITSLSLVRDIQLDLALFPSLENLGTYEEIFADAALDAKYKSVYDYETPVTYIDEEGIEHSYSKPKKICVFA